MAQQLKSLLSNFFPEQKAWKQELLSNWQTIVGDLHKHVYIVNIKNDTLVLGVHDSNWLQELYLLSPVLIKTINNHLGESRIAQLRFKNGGRKKEKRSAKRSTVRNVKKINVHLNTIEKKALEKIDDNELKTALKNFLIRCYKEK